MAEYVQDGYDMHRIMPLCPPTESAGLMSRCKQICQNGDVNFYAKRRESMHGIDSVGGKGEKMPLVSAGVH